MWDKVVNKIMVTATEIEEIQCTCGGKTAKVLTDSFNKVKYMRCTNCFKRTVRNLLME